MKAELKIKEIVIDNAEVIAKELQKGTDFQLMTYDASDEDRAVGIFLEHTDKNKDCTMCNKPVQNIKLWIDYVYNVRIGTQNYTILEMSNHQGFN